MKRMSSSRLSVSRWSNQKSSTGLRLMAYLLDLLDSDLGDDRLVVGDRVGTAEIPIGSPQKRIGTR